MSNVPFRLRCFQCGECCKACACGFGVYDHTLGQCSSLVPVESNFGFSIYSCAIYAEIIKNPTSVYSPAFGSGCCRTMFNDARNAIMKHTLHDEKNTTHLPLDADDEIVDKALEAWHGADPLSEVSSFSEYIGWTEDEYALWLTRSCRRLR